MTKVQDIVSILGTLAPWEHALSFDKVGLQIGDPSAKVNVGVISLDRSLAAVSYAANVRAEVLISHHPVVWEPMKQVRKDDYIGSVVMKLIEHKIALIAAHTNWDAAKDGINETLAEIFELQDLHSYGVGESLKRFKLVVFVPKDSTQQIIDALSEAGAGVIGNYHRCAFLTEGTGTFFGVEGAKPAIGKTHQIEQVVEDRLEMILPASQEKAVIQALFKSHPYDEPAFDLFPLEYTKNQPLGRIGILRHPMTLQELCLLADEKLETRTLAWGNPEKRISTLAVTGGAGANDWKEAQISGADGLLTGEIPQHLALEASESGLAILSSGHYATEHPGCRSLMQKLQIRLPDIEWKLFTPKPGEAGRPIYNSGSLIDLSLV